MTSGARSRASESPTRVRDRLAKEMAIRRRSGTQPSPRSPLRRAILTDRILRRRFPAYPSGHAGFGGALFETLRKFYGRDRIPFTFVSDEYNGVTRDNNGNVRPLKPRSFNSLSDAEEENGQSRIYLGIHWSFDKSEGISQGRKVADYVFTRAFKPLHTSNDRLQRHSLR